MWTLELRRSDGRLIEQQMNLPDTALRHWLQDYVPHASEVLVLFNDNLHQLVRAMRERGNLFAIVICGPAGMTESQPDPAARSRGVGRLSSWRDPPER